MDKANASPLIRGWHWLKFNTLGLFSEVFVAQKINKGIWKGYTEESLRDQLKAAGFKVEWIKNVYGNTSYFAQCALESEKGKGKEKANLAFYANMKGA